MNPQVLEIETKSESEWKAIRAILVLVATVALSVGVSFLAAQIGTAAIILSSCFGGSLIIKSGGHAIGVYQDSKARRELASSLGKAAMIGARNGQMINTIESTKRLMGEWVE